MVRYKVQVLSTVIDTFDKVEDAIRKYSFLKQMGLDAKVFKEEVEQQEDPVVLDKVWRVVKSEQIF